MSSNCPLCESHSVQKFYFQELFKRQFYKCGSCDLIFVKRDNTLGLTQQKDHYDQHENSELTAGYQKFLERLVVPLQKRKLENASGLDFGSGPYPMLKKLLQNHGFVSVETYDPIYAPHVSSLERKYGFITCCEVIEHFVDVKRDLELLFGLIKKKGILIISTELFHSEVDFKNWYYIRDITHINIFSHKTLNYLANKFNTSVEITGSNLISFLKK